MARLNALQLQDRVTNDENGIRQELFDYLRTNTVLPPGLNPVQKRMFFEGEIIGMTHQAQVWINIYLPVYNTVHQSWLAQKLPNINIPLDDKVTGALGTGVATAGAGLVGLITATFIGNEAAKDVVEIASKAAIYVSPAVIFANYAANFVNDKGKSALRKASFVAGLSLAVLLVSQGTDNETMQTAMELGSKAGLAASAVGALYSVAKHR